MLHRRPWLANVALLAAMLALMVAAVVPATHAATPSPTAGGTPEITGTIPNPKDPKGLQNWTGDQVVVNYKANGAELDLEACTLYVNDILQPLGAPPNIVPAVSRATSSLRYKWDSPYKEGNYEFRAVLVTTTGEEVEHSWSFGSKGEAGAGSLVSFQVMRDWFGFIAQGAIITVELTVISIVLASLLALLGSLGQALAEDELQAGLAALPELGLHGPPGSQPHPLLDRDVLHLALPGDPAAAADHRHLLGDPRGDQVLRSAGVVQSGSPSGQASPPSRSTTVRTSPRSSAPASRRCPRASTRPPGR